MIALLLHLACQPGARDADGDGAPASADCDDADARYTVARAWALDEDGDGYGDATYSVRACAPPEGFAGRSGDCDDHAAAVHPDAPERCGGGDEDCDGEIDEGDAEDAPAWFTDSDGDGAGDPGSEVGSCTAPAGTTPVGGDCDDEEPEVAPGHAERCDGVDEDCDGVVDDLADGEIEGTTWYADLDGDGHGDPTNVVYACDAPPSFTPSADDCDDADPAIHPEAPERCNALDDDCDVRVDEPDGPLDGAPTWYVDGDTDGYGSPALAEPACAAPPGFVASDEDCDDADPNVHPSAAESCDDRDEDCDGVVDDDATDALAWYADLDGDGYGDPGSMILSCTPAGIADASDCDDADATIAPWATETCDDGTDQDCDGFERPCPLGASVVLGVAGDQWNGETADDRSGHAVAWAGDTNGDGLDEALMTAYREDSVYARAGALYVVTTTGVVTSTFASATSKLTGENAGDHAGSSVAGVGDTDGDGLDDVLLGAYLAAPSYAGAAYLLTGPLASGSVSGASARLGGEADDDEAGSSIAGPGDVDGDGRADLLIGAPNHDDAEEEVGVAALFLGPVTGSTTLATADARIEGTTRAARSGAAVAGGDLDGDGLADVVVTAAGAVDGGAFYVFAGPILGDLTLADALARGPASEVGDQHGAALSLGDAQGDGYADLLCGAPANGASVPYAGAAYLYRGPLSGELPAASADARLLGESTADYAGYSVDLHGDFDGDGRSDALVGAWAEDETATTSGATYVELGPFTGVTSLGDVYAKLVSESGGTESGRSVAGGGDIDGDGLSDILVGAPDISESDRGAGGVYLLLGADL